MVEVEDIVNEEDFLKEVKDEILMDDEVNKATWMHAYTKFG